jgi:hypothetical protein
MCPPIFPERMSIKRLSRLWSYGFAGLLALHAAACQAAVPSPAPATTAPTRREPATPTHSVALPTLTQVVLDQPFELAIGEQVVLSDTDLHLRFERMLEDSRCPRQVACFWSGQARLAISLWGFGAAPETIEFSTYSQPPKTTDTHTFHGFSICLVAVDPYPDSPDQPILAGAYRITILVTRL